MRFIAKASLLLSLVTPCVAQTISPSQIQPSSVSGQVLTTVTALTPPSWQTPTGGGTGTVTTSGTPTIGVIAKFTGSTVIGNATASDIVGLFGLCSGTEYLGADGNCHAGSGSVTLLTAPSASWPTWLVPTVTNPTTTPNLTVAASAIPNSALANTIITVNSVACTLGSSCSVPSGSVSTVSVVTANGVSGSVANPTTTPAITLSLGAINPTSIGVTTPGSIVGTTVTATTDFVGAGTGLTGTASSLTAGLATSLAGTPTLCSTGNAPTGILASGNATGCAAIGGGSPGGALGAAQFNNTSLGGNSHRIDASAQSGADLSVKINAAFTQLTGSSLTGTVDATNFTGTQTLSANITVPAGDTLLLPCATINRNSGIQIKVNTNSTIKGCSSWTSGTLTNIVGGGGDSSTTIIGAASSVANVHFEDFAITGGATGAIGINWAGFINSNSYRMLVTTDIGYVFDGTTACSCYNGMHEDVIQGTSYGYKFLANGNQNVIYGGQQWGAVDGVYIAATAGHNQIIGGDKEGAASTAPIEIAGNGNSLYSEYLEATGNVIIDSGAVSNYIVGAGNVVVTDNSGNCSNFVQTTGGGGGNYGNSPCSLATQNQIVFGGDLSGSTTSANVGMVLLGPGYGNTGGVTNWEWAGYNNNVGLQGNAPLGVGGFYPSGGVTETGSFGLSALGNPSAPTITNHGTGGSTTYQYSIVCEDWNGGQSTQSATGQTTTGNATLSGTNYNGIAYSCGSNYRRADILKFSGGTWQRLAYTYPNSTSTNVVNDTGGALTAFTLPTRNTTGDLSVAGELITAASTTSSAGLNVPHGTAPTSPVNGDLWTTVSGLYARINGTTVGPYTDGTGFCHLSGCTITGNLQVNGAIQVINILQSAGPIEAQSQTLATNTTNSSSPIFQLQGNVWAGSSTADFWQIQNVETNTGGSTGTSVLTFLDGGIGGITYSIALPAVPVTVGGNKVLAPVNGAVTSATGGTGTGTVTCLTASCTNVSGSYSVAGGTFTTGTFLTLVWPTTTAVYKCWVAQNGGSATYGLGHGVATATGMTVTAGISVLGVTVSFDYGCSAE